MDKTTALCYRVTGQLGCLSNTGRQFCHRTSGKPQMLGKIANRRYGFDPGFPRRL
jgi:hypothetical protein